MIRGMFNLWGPDVDAPAPAQGGGDRAEAPQVAMLRPQTNVAEDSMRDLITTYRGRLAEQNLPAVRTAWRRVVPLRVSAARENVYQRAPAENAAIFENLGGVNGGLLRSILREIDLPPFARDAMMNHNLDMDGLLVAGFICSLRCRQSSHRTQQMILEVMVPNLPHDMAMPRDNAQAELGRILADTATLADAAWFADAVEVLRRLDDRAPAEARVWVVNDRTWAANTTLGQRLLFLLWVARNVPSDRFRNRVVSPILLTLVSFATRGNLTTQKLGRIIADLQTVIPFVNEALNVNDLRLTWANFGHYVDDNCMPGIMRRWLGLIPAQAIRLRVVLAQAAGSGLTALDVIARAVHEHPDFPWTLIRRLYPEEWDNAGTAIAMVGNNPYFGFRRDLVEVRSTRYRNISAFCGQLLIAAGDTTLQNYRGFVPDRARQDQWKLWIDTYLKAKAALADNDQPISDEDMAHHNHMVRLVAAYPTNVGELARMDGHPDPEDADDPGEGAAAVFNIQARADLNEEDGDDDE